MNVKGRRKADLGTLADTVRAGHHRLHQTTSLSAPNSSPPRRRRKVLLGIQGRAAPTGFVPYNTRSAILRGRSFHAPDLEAAHQ